MMREKFQKEKEEIELLLMRYDRKRSSPKKGQQKPSAKEEDPETTKKKYSKEHGR